AIRLPDKRVQISALKKILDIVLNGPENVVSIYENNIISELNKFITNEEKEEVLSITILHVIRVRRKTFDSKIRIRTATESLIQIIHSPIEKQSKSGSKALRNLIAENLEIRNSLMKAQHLIM
ncbi:MAG: hypothetical protein EZS28_049716, partial [Streblomastix strix]